MPSYETLLLIGFAFFLGGFVKGVVGLGVPVVVLAILATTVGLKETMALLLVPTIAMNLWQGLSGGNFLMLVRRLWFKLLCAGLGIWLGVEVLIRIDTHWMVLGLGIILFIYAVLSLRRPQIRPPGKHEFWLSPVVGMVAGFVFGASGTYMVPGVLYIQALGLARDQLIQALGITFFTISTMLGLAFWYHGLLNVQTGWVSAAAFVPMSLGMIAGRRYRYSLSETVFRKMFFSALMFAGIYMVGRNIL